MRNTLLLLSWLFCILLTGSLNCLSADKDSKKIWTDPKKRQLRILIFHSGRIRCKGLGFQAAAVGNNKFYSGKFNGGLPGQGWDGSDPEVEILNADDLKEIVKGMKKELRVSPSLGAEPPAGAVVLFDGKKNPKIKGQVKDGLLLAGAQTTGE